MSTRSSCSLPVASTCLSLQGQPSPSTLLLCALAQPPSGVMLPAQGLSQHGIAPTRTRVAPQPAAFCCREAQERRGTWLRVLASSRGQTRQSGSLGASGKRWALRVLGSEVCGLAGLGRGSWWLSSCAKSVVETQKSQRPVVLWRQDEGLRGGWRK